MVYEGTEMAELFDLLRDIFEEQIPFNKVLGVRVESLDMEGVCLKIEMKKELIGNPLKAVLHGGVISSILDAAGGITAMWGMLKKLAQSPMEEIGKRLFNVGTIDLRVDYLRPGRGKYFLATASIMRTGQRVAVIRMQLHNDKKSLIAVGTGTYIVG